MTKRIGGGSPGEHAGLEALPEWPQRTVGVLATVDDGPHAIPISAPVRAGDRRILLGLHRDRGSLGRLREDPRVALLVLTEGDTAFTAHGRARVIAEPLAGAPDYVAIEIAVEAVDSKPTAVPAMMFVAGPVRLALAISWTGRQVPAV